MRQVFAVSTQVCQMMRPRSAQQASQSLRTSLHVQVQKEVAESAALGKPFSTQLPCGNVAEGAAGGQLSVPAFETICVGLLFVSVPLIIWRKFGVRNGGMLPL